MDNAVSRAGLIPTLAGAVQDMDRRMLGAIPVQLASCGSLGRAKSGVWGVDSGAESILVPWVLTVLYDRCLSSLTTGLLDERT